MKKIKLFPVILLVLATSLKAQKDAYQNLYFIKRSVQPAFAEKDYTPGKSGFYIYRNCIYDLVLKNKLQLSVKIIDIKNDSIYYILHFNENVAVKNKLARDTLSLHPSVVKRIKLIGDRIMGIYSGQALAGYKYVFEEGAEPKKFNPRFTIAYSEDSSRSTTYELVPYLTAQGIDMLYEQCGVTYYFQGISDEPCLDTSKRKFISKKGIWFSPSNANEVRGLNIGLLTMNFSMDSLKINGVNLNLDLISMLMSFPTLLYTPFNNALINMPDSIDKSTVTNKINGLSLSMGGLIGNN